MQIYWNKRKRLHKKRVQLPQVWFGTQKWPSFHCFGTQMWPPWRHVKLSYSLCTCITLFCIFLCGCCTTTTWNLLVLRWCLNKRDDLKQRFLAQHSVAIFEQCCNHSKQCRNTVATLCDAKNRRCESSRVSSPLRFIEDVNARQQFSFPFCRLRYSPSQWTPVKFPRSIFNFNRRTWQCLSKFVEMHSLSARSHSLSKNQLDRLCRTYSQSIIWYFLLFILMPFLS